MADQKPAANVSTPGQTKPAADAPFSFDALVKTAKVIKGFDLVEKAELIGVEFVITGVRFESGARNVGYVYVNGVKRNGEKFTFNDSSSTGIKAQIMDAVSDDKLSTEYDTGEVVPVTIHVPRGVRVSEYQITDVRGKERNARTYYLTTGNQD